MVRLSRVNIYLHGFPNPVIHEYDTLTSEERWDKRCEVIMANPPFMTPKGGIRPLSGDRCRTAAARQKGKWPMVKLGAVGLFRIESGGTPSSTNQEYWAGNICWATLVDLPQEELVCELRDTQRKITKKGLKESSAVLLPPNSIIVSSRATIGRIAVNSIPIATNQGFKNVVIEDKDRASAKFVAYAILRLVPKMEMIATGGTFNEISKTDFSNLEIPLPPLEEQERIVAELEWYWKEIEHLRKEIEDLHIKIKQKVASIWSAGACSRLAKAVASHSTQDYSGDSAAAL